MVNEGTSSEPSLGRRIRVLLPLPLGGAFDYLYPDATPPPPGTYVVAPLGRREVVGVIWDGEDANGVDEDRLKAVEAIFDAPPLPGVCRRFVEWVARYNLCPPGAVLRMVLRVPAALDPAPPRIAYRLGGPPPARVTPARRRVLDLMAEGPARQPAEIAEIAGVGQQVVRGLINAGTLQPVSLPPWPDFPAPDTTRPGPRLSAAQKAAADALAETVRARTFAVTLLEGVTGAGKTEVYFEAIAAALQDGRQVLVLLPEIALTAQWLARFSERFGAAPAVWHSDLRQSERRRTWRAVAEGAARLVVGARSALFLPFPDLGLIVVDEEHDTSFKQEDGVHYHARDMAVVRGALGDIGVVLASATPSLETLANVESERYRHLVLPERHGPAELPAIETVDMRRDPPPAQRWLSPPLRAAIDGTLADSEQVLLFLNRRGYAPMMICGACGFRLACPNCSAWLVEHRFSRRVQCHHCGHTRRVPETCGECGARGAMRACGPGVERIAEEVGQLYPEARLALMTSDTLSGPAAAADIVNAVAAHEIDVLIGTQVVAKGHHFPMLTLVGIIDADLGLEGGDLRAAERTFQLLSQVSGRAGRAERAGRVVVQTYQPDHPVMAALVTGDRRRFIAAEMAARRAAGMPPFGRLVALIVTGRDLGAVSQTAHALARAAPRAEGVLVLGPAPAPLSLIRGRHRQRLLVKAGRQVNVQQLVTAWLDRVKPTGGARIIVDVDPYSFQ